MTRSASRLTVPQFVALKRSGRKISMLTAYDYTMAALIDSVGREDAAKESAGVDSILVGDSLGMVVQGRQHTLGVTLDQIVYHAEMVGRAVKRALVVVDLPFPTNHLGAHRAVECAARILKETDCQAVKLEGGADQADVIRALVMAGIPVMAHCGLRPQSVHVLGGYKVQRQEESLLADAHAAQDAGAFGLVIECVPSEIAARITRELAIPTIGIGAGADCDGQVLVTHDMLGLTAGYVPRFAKQFADLGTQLTRAVGHYVQDVRAGSFPGPQQSFQ